MKKRIELTFFLEQICNDLLAACNLISNSIKEEGWEDIKASVKTPDSPETGSIINRAVTEGFGKVKKACQRYLTVGRTEDDNRLERLVKSVSYGKKEVQDADDSGHLLFSIVYHAVDEQDHPLYTITIVDEPDTAIAYRVEGGWHLAYGSTFFGDNVIVDAVPITATATAYKVEDGWQKVDTSDIIPDSLVTQSTPIMVEVTDYDNPFLTYETVSLVLEIPDFNISVTDDLKSNIHKLVFDWTMGKFLEHLVPDKADAYKTLAEGDDYSNIIKDLNARDNYTMRRPSFM